MATERSEIDPHAVLLKKLGSVAQSLAIQRMHENWAREGWKAAVLDFKGFDYQGSDWEVKEGWVIIHPYPAVIDLAHAQNVEGDQMTSVEKMEKIAHEINAYCDQRLGSFPWYKSYNSAGPRHELTSLLPAEEIQRSLGYPQGFKLLGENGANFAVDPTIFVVEEECVRVLSIIRTLDQARALPGGIVPRLDAVKQKCIDELLEECFSGKFFAPGSVTSQMIDTTLTISTKELMTSMRAMIAGWKDADASTREKLLVYMDSLLQDTGDLPQGLHSEVIQAMGGYIQSMGLSVCEEAQILSSLRVGLYKQFCVEAYTHVKDALKARMTMGMQVANLTDPRTTCGTGMVTQTVSMCFRAEDISSTFKAYGLEENAAGDDAQHAHFPTLYEFCCGSDYPPFSDHARLVLDALGDQIADGQLTLSLALMKELLAITEGFETQCTMRSSKTVEILSLCGEIKNTLGQWMRLHTKVFSLSTSSHASFASVVSSREFLSDAEPSCKELRK